MMNISSKKVASEVRYARVAAENPERGVTLDEMEAFVVAAKAAEVPGETPVQVQGFILTASTPFLQVQATVETAL